MKNSKKNSVINESAILLIHCVDTKGIVFSVTEFIFKHNGNIKYLEQHVDSSSGVFFMRIEWSLDQFFISKEKIAATFDEQIGTAFSMQWRLYFSSDVSKIAIFVSKISHCLYDLLSRWKSGELNVEIPVIISNHENMQDVARQFGIDYHYFPVNQQSKYEHEIKQLKLMRDYEINLVVLARYMQILTENFVNEYQDRIINIHHSFLPAFPGARPYHSAYERGVKIIGATSHYVTAQLDAGPIIEQDVVRVSHVDSVDDMKRKGRDLEKIVLSRAVRYHVEHKTLVYENRTIVFT